MYHADAIASVSIRTVEEMILNVRASA